MTLFFSLDNLNNNRSNYKWFKIDKNVIPNEETPEFVAYNTARFQETPEQAAAFVQSQNIPLPLALKMLQ